MRFFEQLISKFNQRDPDASSKEGEGGNAETPSKAGTDGEHTENDIKTDELSQTNYLRKSDRIIQLLESAGGRMKQSEFVSETDWSKATVSRELSRLDEEGDIHKISIGRENVITLAGAEPDWYTPPDTADGENAQKTVAASDVSNEPAILLVEDDEQEAELLKEAFKDVDLTNPVHVVRDGVDALEFILQRGPYANAPSLGLVLLDLSLITVDGMDVLEELCERKALQGIPILVLSQSDMAADVRRAYELGATAYLTKPKDFDELVGLSRAIDDFWLSTFVTRPK